MYFPLAITLDNDLDLWLDWFDIDWVLGGLDLTPEFGLELYVLDAPSLHSLCSRIMDDCLDLADIRLFIGVVGGDDVSVISSSSLSSSIGLARQIGILCRG